MATAALDASAAAPAGKGKKKLIIIVVALLLVLAIGGAGAVLLMKKNAAAYAEDEDDDGPVATKVETKAKTPGAPPTYVALDPFTVNLADKDAERFAQVAVTLEVDDPKFAEQMKVYMPAIRNAILMILAHKTSTELLERAGKEALATEIKREAVRPMGIEIEPEEADDEAADTGSKRKKKRRAAVHNPVSNVLFANFIVQ